MLRSLWFSQVQRTISSYPYADWLVVYITEMEHPLFCFCFLRELSHLISLNFNHSLVYFKLTFGLIGCVDYLGAVHEDSIEL